MGLVVDHNGEGQVVGYFFIQRFDELPTFEQANSSTLADVIQSFRFGDLGIIEFDWKVIGQRDRYDIDEWPTPIFGSVVGRNRAAKCIYQRGQFDERDAKIAICLEEAKTLPDNWLAGCGLVEIRLTKLLSRTLDSPS